MYHQYLATNDREVRPDLRHFDLVCDAYRILYKTKNKQTATSNGNSNTDHAVDSTDGSALSPEDIFNKIETIMKMKNRIHPLQQKKNFHREKKPTKNTN